MKIGFFTDTYHPSINGVVTSIKMLEKELIKRGHEVYIFAPSKHESLEGLDNVYMLKSMPAFFLKGYKFRVAAFYSRSVAAKIKELDLDILHIHTEYSLGLFGKIIARKFKKPYVNTFHTMLGDYAHYIMPSIIFGEKIPNALAKEVARRATKGSSAIIAPSQKTKDYIEKDCKINNKRVEIIPTGIDLTNFKNDCINEKNILKLKRDLGIAPDDKVLLFLGRLAKEKSINVLIEQTEKLLKKEKNIKLVIVGYGPYEELLKEQVKNLGLDNKVIFTGRVDWEKIGLYYAIGDIFINASTSETQGLTYIEAMAAGKPIVCKYDTNLAEVIKDGENGIFFYKDNELEEKISNLINNEELKRKLIKNGLETSKDYSSIVFGDKVLELYKDIIDNKKKKDSK